MGIDMKRLEQTLRQRPELVLPLATFCLKRIATQVQTESRLSGDWVQARTKVMDRLGIHGVMREVLQNALGSYFQKIAEVVVHRRKHGTQLAKSQKRPPLDESEKRRRKKRVRTEEAGQLAWTFHQEPTKTKGRS